MLSTLVFQTGALVVPDQDNQSAGWSLGAAAAAASSLTGSMWNRSSLLSRPSPAQLDAARLHDSARPPAESGLWSPRLRGV